MTKQEAKDKAAQERGYKDWVHAMYLMNENGISELTDKALDIYLNENFKPAPEGR